MKSSRTSAPASPPPISSRKSETPLPPQEFRRDKPPDPRVAFSLIGRPGARLIPNDGRGRRSLAFAGSRGEAGPLYCEGFYWLSHMSSNQRAGVGRTSYAKFSKNSRASAGPSPAAKPLAMTSPLSQEHRSIRAWSWTRWRRRTSQSDQAASSMAMA
jgi:hypothetical protein